MKDQIIGKLDYTLNHQKTGLSTCEKRYWEIDVKQI